MSDLIVCPINGMTMFKNNQTNKLGRDQTGTVDYFFNSQGWRAKYDYNFVPEYAFFGSSLVLGVGVNQDQIFSSFFDSAHNYGLATSYTNQDIASTIVDFANSKYFSPQTKLAVVWTDRDPNMIVKSWRQLEEINIVHFFCGQPLDYPKCNRMPAPIDADVSDTHPGPRSHRFFYKVLQHLLK